jgi:putative phosphoribosyl transferase
MLHAMELSEGIVFADRRHAGRLLAEALRAQKLEDAVVVGLARGGVVVAAEVARALGLPLDVLAVRKIGHPLQPEYGLGAVTPGGAAYVRPGAGGLTETELDDLVAATSRKAEDLDARLHADHAPLSLRGRTCLLVDDGLATGATMLAAVQWARQKGARRVVTAVPVGAPQTVETLVREVDAVVCLEQPEWMSAVGLWYRDFEQVSDDEVTELLRAAWRHGLERRQVVIAADDVELVGDLTLPADTIALVVFAHGSGSSRRSPRNMTVAGVLNQAGIATLLFDLLTRAEELDRRNVFDIDLLAGRLESATEWLLREPAAEGKGVGYFGASTGAAAALRAAAALGPRLAAVVSRGGRPDLAGGALEEVAAPTLLIVGGADEAVLDLNREAAGRLRCPHELVVVPGATHLFEEPGALERVAELARDWFLRHLAR